MQADGDGPAVAMDAASECSFATAPSEMSEDNDNDYQLASQVIPRLKFKRVATDPPDHGYNLRSKRSRWTVEQVECIELTKQWFRGLL